MSAGILKVHGYSAAPSQRPSTISFFTINFPVHIKTSATTTSDIGVTNGALDQIFSRAVSQFATVAMIGTVASNGQSIRFAIEDSGADANSPSGLGLGNGSSAFTSTQTAMETSIRALGTVNGIALNTTTVTVTSFTL